MPFRAAGSAAAASQIYETLERGWFYLSKEKKIAIVLLVVVCVGSLGMLGYNIYDRYFRKPPRDPFIQAIIDDCSLYFPGLLTVPALNGKTIDVEFPEKYPIISDKDSGIVAMPASFLYPIPLNPNYEIKDIDFAAWKAKNEEVIGYIEFEELSVVSYPVLFRDGSDFYLKHDISGASDIYGEIYVEGAIKYGHSKTNTIIYGHNMRNGTMFGSLRKYKEASYYPGHEFFWYYTPNGKYRYQIFSVYETLYTSDTFTWYEKPSPEYTAYLQKMKSQSKYETGVTPSDTDEIITLCTCTSAGGSYRLVLQARLIYKDEDEEAVAAQEAAIAAQEAAASAAPTASPAP